jgi:hypothetical protein
MAMNMAHIVLWHGSHAANRVDCAAAVLDFCASFSSRGAVQTAFSSEFAIKNKVAALAERAPAAVFA